MKKLSIWFGLLVKRQLKSVIFLALLLGIPVLTFVVVNTPSFQEERVNQVGLFLEDEDPVAVRCAMDLLQNETYEFFLCDSREELVDKVIRNQVECGFVFENNLTDKIGNGKAKKGVLCVKKESSVLAGAIRETVFQAYFRQVSGVILLNYAQTKEELSWVPEEGLDILRQTYEAYLESDRIFKVDFKMLGDADSFAETVDIKVQEATFPLRNMMAVFIMVGAVLGVIGWLSDREKGVFVPMKREFVMVSRVMYPFIPALLLCISTLVSLLVAGKAEDFGREVPALVCYLVILSFTGAIMSRIFQRSITLVGVLPIMILTCIILCPVFIDLANMIPVIKFIRFLLPPYYYMLFF